MNSIRNIFSIVLGTALLSGCAASGLFSDFESAPSQNEGAAGIYDDSTIAGYFELLENLLDGDSVIQAETFQRVTAQEADQSDTTNRLRLALALGTPGHAGSNAQHAQRELRELLAASELLLPEERLLALIYLAQIEQRLLLDLEAAQTQTAALESLSEQTTALELRLRAAQDENQSLRQQLEQAQNIIDEITNIEQSIRERESAD